jgi:hypothetical protein
MSEVGRGASEVSILEARDGRGLVHIGTGALPTFSVDGRVTISSALVDPAFGIMLSEPGPDAVDRWLRKREIIVTAISRNENRLSSWSWVCRYVGCTSISRVSEGLGIWVVSGMEFKS